MRGACRTRKRCAVCGEWFDCASNRQRYCPDCKAVAYRAKAAERARRRRERRKGATA